MLYASYSESIDCRRSSPFGGCPWTVCRGLRRKALEFFACPATIRPRSGGVTRGGMTLISGLHSLLPLSRRMERGVAKGVEEVGLSTGGVGR